MNTELVDKEGNPISVPGFNGHQVMINGLATFYVEGPRNGPPLLLISGVNEVWQNYIPVLDALSRHHHIYLCDLRGHGKTGWSEDRKYRVIDYAQDAEQFIETVIGEPCNVAGHSLGALIAVKLASSANALVKSVSLEDPPILITEWAVFGKDSFWMRHIFKAMLDAVAESREKEWSLEELTERLHNTIPFRVNPNPEQPERRIIGLAKMLQKLRDFNALPPPGSEAYERFTKGCIKLLGGELTTLSEMEAPKFIAKTIATDFVHMDLATLEGALAPTFSEGFNQRDALANIHRPTLIFWSDPDIIGFLNDQGRADVKSLVPGPVEEVIVENAGHHVHADATDLFIEKLNAHFS